jgi:hypothetical protein
VPQPTAPPRTPQKHKIENKNRKQKEHKKSIIKHLSSN